MKEGTAGIKINGTPTNSIRYADDTAILVKNIEDLQRLMNKMAECGEEYMNFKDPSFNENNYHVNSIENFRNTILVQLLTHLRTTKTKYNPDKARKNFVKSALCNKVLSLCVRIRLVMLQCYIFTVLIYGAAARTLNAVTTGRMKAFQMWIILKVSWVDRIINIEIMRKIREKAEYIETNENRKLEYLNHVIRGENSHAQLIIQGKQSVGRRKTLYVAA